MWETVYMFLLDIWNYFLRRHRILFFVLFPLFILYPLCLLNHWLQDTQFGLLDKALSLESGECRSKCGSLARKLGYHVFIVVINKPFTAITASRTAPLTAVSGDWLPFPKVIFRDF